MSIKVIGQVMQRYPAGGGEYTLALALAWHAADDGTRIFPSVRTLAEESRQSVRTVQYQLKRMQESGWLQLVGNAHGGTGRTRQYRINPEWLAGELTSSASNHSEPATEGTVASVAKTATDDRQLQTFAQWTAACRAANVEAIPAQSPVFEYANQIGLPRHYLFLQWAKFCDAHRRQPAKRHRDWPARFLRSVERNSYGLWVLKPSGHFELTTVGRQAELHGSRT